MKTFSVKIGLVMEHNSKSRSSPKDLIENYPWVATSHKPSITWCQIWNF